MELKTAYYNGGPTVLDVNLSYGELSWIMYVLDKTADLPTDDLFNLTEQGVTATVSKGIHAVLQEATDNVKRFQK